MRQSTLTQERFYPGVLHNKWARIALQVLLVAGFSVLTALAKKAHPHLGIPSSSAPYWLSAMILARCTMKWDGSGVLVGIGTALWGIPISLNQGFAQNLASFAFAGAALDIMTRIPGINIRRWWGAIVCALVANLAQFGVIIYSALTSPILKHFELVGMMESTSLHIGFGIAAGLIGWAAFRGAQTGLQRFFPIQ
jgi:hypothetical protein